MIYNYSKTVIIVLFICHFFLLFSYRTNTYEENLKILILKYAVVEKKWI